MAENDMQVQNRARVLGSAYTVWFWQTDTGTKPVAWAREVSHTSPQPVAQSVAIQPLNWTRPAEIATPRAQGHGEITLSIIERWGFRPWESLVGLDNCSDLTDVFHKMKQDADAVKNTRLMKVIRHTSGPGAQGALSGRNSPGAFEIVKYNGVKIVDIREDETANVEAMENVLTVTVWYTGADRTVGPNSSVAALVANRLGDR